MIPKGNFLFAYGDVAVANVNHANVYGRSSDIPVMQQSRQARLAEKHLDEVRVADESWQDALETNTLLEAARATTDRHKCLRHTADAEALDQLVVT